MAQKATTKQQAGNQQEPMESAQVPATIDSPGGPPALQDDPLQGYSGMEGLDDSVFVIPRMKIVQPTSKEGTAGTFRMNLTGEAYKSIRVVGIKAETGRIFWDRESDAQAEEPACKSYDGRSPADEIESPPSAVCVEPEILKSGKTVLLPICPMAVWGEKGERPPCDVVYNLLLLSADDDLPFWITIGGASITAFKKFVSTIHLRRGKLYDFETVIALEERKEPHKHFVLSFTPPKPVAKDFQAHIYELVQNFRHESLKRTPETAPGNNGSTLKQVFEAETDAPNEKPNWMEDPL